MGAETAVMEQGASWRVWVVTGGATVLLATMICGGVGGAVVLARGGSPRIEERAADVAVAAEPVVRDVTAEAPPLGAVGAEAPAAPALSDWTEGAVGGAQDRADPPPPPSSPDRGAAAANTRRAPATRGHRAPAADTPPTDAAAASALPPAPAEEAVRLVVRAGPRARDVSLSVDGSDAGALPATVSIQPGTHALRFTRSDGELDLTCSVQVGDGGRSFEFDGRRPRCPG